MQWLLIFFYCSLICWGISKLNFFINSGIKIKWWISIFLFKVFIGIIYGLIHSQEYGGGDTLYGFTQGLRIYNTLPNNGIEIFFKLVFLPCHYPAYDGVEKWVYSSIAYGDESYYFIIRLHALMAIFSGGFYNVHVVFFNLLSFAGVAFLFSAFSHELQSKKSWILFALVLIPSVVFWTSGIHKDGLALLSLGMIFYSIKKRKKYSLTHFIPGIVGILLLFIVRSYILLIIIPLILIYLLFKKREKNLIWLYSAGFLVFVLLILFITSISKTISPVNKLIWWQTAFNALDTTENTQFLPTLQPTAVSFLSIIPVAINHSFFQPEPWNAINLYQFIIGIQDYLLAIILLSLIVFSIIKRKVFSHLFFLSIGYCLLLYVLLGIIVPNLGALSRYKSTGTFFLCLSIISLIPVEWIKKYFKY